MKSHTVPRRLLELFTFTDPVTNSSRLWRYEKGREPYGPVSTKSATRWDGHFADPADPEKEAAIEQRLNLEFEIPVKQLIQDIAHRDTAGLSVEERTMLTRYITVLFNRTKARRAVSGHQQQRAMDGFRALQRDPGRLKELAAHMTAEMFMQGVTYAIKPHEIAQLIGRFIDQNSNSEEVRRWYVRTIETMMAYTDAGMIGGEWRVVRAQLTARFVIGDAPVVTWVRDGSGSVAHGFGFAKPNVEVVVPIAPTASLHILPQVDRTTVVQEPTVAEVNLAQAAFATQYCFANVNSAELNQLLQPAFGTIQLGVNAFVTDFDYAAVLFEILTGRLPARNKQASK